MSDLIYIIIIYDRICPIANEQPDLALINQRIRDNIQAISNFSSARKAGR